ncbi:CAP domain-containing protein [Aeromicrobium stalagmiti]|uniref:CAP domain-containing protein n=1 Tax=Aeromicrobium stalagmiti TaxID=2738988 RepID=UPI001569D74E|nr:CAP domain-containing protein [Aeromicrobium stalagmiti]NRQ50467.1 CAP domain-containing protein [Aeromicrobium stalagmiti]
MTASRNRALRVVAIAALLLLVSITPASAVSSSTYETQVIDRTNTYRVAHDKVKVKAHSCVDRWAEGQARWMAARGTLEHRKGRMEKILKDCNLTGVSENIAMGFSSGNKTVNAWMDSSGHRRNILATKMRYVGVGAVKDSDGVWWVAQVFGTRK